MKNVEELKKDIHENPEIIKHFLGVKNKKEVTEVAKRLGYKVSEKEIKYDEELNKDMLETVAGGKGDTKIKQDYVIVAESDKYESVDIDHKTGEVKDFKLKK